MSYQDWRERLQDVVDDGLRELRSAQVIAALSAELGRARDGQPRARPAEPRLEVGVPVLGVDGCSGGWVGVLLAPGVPSRVLAATTVPALVELARQAVDVAVVAIDIPIGLPDQGRRRADVLARAALPGKQSSVFTTLTRASWAAPTRVEADAVNRQTAGQGVPPYTYALRDKVLEVDGWLRTRPVVRVVEVHPELSFAEMAAGPLLAPKRRPEGADARRAALRGVGFPVPPYYRDPAFREDDLLDACAAAWTALRCAAGTAHSLPDPPERFSDGLPAAIFV